MYDANVLGVMRMTQALLPKLEASGDGHVVMIGLDRRARGRTPAAPATTPPSSALGP